MKLRINRPEPGREGYRETRRRRGAALVMTLLVISMLTIMVMAYFITMRTEQQAAFAYSNSQRAKMVAQGAVSHGIALLRNHIPEPALISETARVAPGENFAVNPGRLTVFDDRGEVTHIPLHTGEVDRDPDSTRDPDVHSADLNEPVPGQRFPAIVATVDAEGNADIDADAPEMRVKWVPLLRNPSDPPTRENPISGRYAFWIDDESSRINFNVALGKPSRSTFDPQGFWQQYDMGMMTPLFTQGRGDVEYNRNSRDREWALGKLRSINLDVLFNEGRDLDHNGLLGHAWLRGFSRYPEAILDFVKLEEEAREAWYHGNKFNLTFYSRSPEFNAFGRSRLFTTNIPLSLEAGPLYQLPFVYNGPEADETDYQIEGVMHLHSLMGTLGFTNSIVDEDLGRVHAANIVNRAQLEMMKRYLEREWPGYEGASFVDKYGEEECYQMAINMLTMARMATTTMAGGGRNASRDWAWRTTSVLYSPHNRQRPGATPERHYWRINLDDDGSGDPGETEEEDPELSGILMIPQVPGPHIMEVRLVFRALRDASGPTKRRIGFRYEVEYYMEGMGPALYLNDFPSKVDYFRMDISGGEPRMPDFYELGPPNAEDGKNRADRNWDHNLYKRVPRPTENNPDRTVRVVNRRSLGSLRAAAGRNVRIASETQAGKNYRNRIVVASPWRYLGPNSRWLANPEDPQPVANDRPFILDAIKTRELGIDVKWRLGMGVRPDTRRPRQMIPIGETENDVLQANFTLDLRETGQQVVSWQINDPRLSWNREQWLLDEKEGGTPGQLNEFAGKPLEPEEDSSEKSKFRYFQRGPGAVQVQKGSGRRYSLGRPDEYNSRSRVTSKGYWSVLHTGIRNQIPWRTMNLGGTETEDISPPDFLLLDLLGATYPMQHDQWRINSTLPDEFSTVSFMNSTAGQINLNSKIYPAGNPYFETPSRRKPLEAVFKHLRSDSEIQTLLDQLEEHQERDFFKYIGELSLLEGFQRSDRDATQFEHEELLRNMAGCLTTKSNTFGLWGAAQVVQKARGHDDWGVFEDGDQVLGEKRFYAVIERYVWPGKDGIPGNAHVDESGTWDRLASQVTANQKWRKLLPPDEWDGTNTDTLFSLPGSPPVYKPGRSQRLVLDRRGTYPWFDGPQAVEMDRYAGHALGKVHWTESTLEEAYNPPQPVIKYRVVYFKYLDE